MGDPSSDPQNLRRIREDAEQRLGREEHEPSYPAPVYGGPPLPPPTPPPQPPPKKGLTLKRGILIGVAILLAALTWIMLGGRIPFVTPMPVYGGPPLPNPRTPALLLALPGIRRLRNWLLTSR